jgi:hypothetical protein
MQWPISVTRASTQLAVAHDDAETFHVATHHDSINAFDDLCLVAAKLLRYCCIRVADQR